MAIGMITRSAELIKLAIEHSAMMCDGLVSILLELIVEGFCLPHSSNFNFQFRPPGWANFGDTLKKIRALAKSHSATERKEISSLVKYKTKFELNHYVCIIFLFLCELLDSFLTWHHFLRRHVLPLLATGVCKIFWHIVLQFQTKDNFHQTWQHVGKYTPQHCLLFICYKCGMLYLFTVYATFLI